MAAVLHLRPHVQACAVRDDLVVLDAQADAYLCLPGGVARLAWRAERRSLTAPDRAAAAELVAANLVQTSPAPPRFRDPPALPFRGLATARSSALTPRQRGALIGATFDLAIGYRGRPFGAILDYARRRPRTSAPQMALEPEAAGLLRALIWAPAPAKCLARSFLLLRALQRCGHDCDWVFGVRTWPFGAHCWLQTGDLALDEAPERLVAYTPIGAV